MSTSIIGTGSESRKATWLARVLFGLGFFWSLAGIYCYLNGCGLMLAAPWLSVSQFVGLSLVLLSTYGFLVWIRFGRIGFWPENIRHLHRLKCWRNAVIFHAICLVAFAGIGLSQGIEYGLLLIFASVHAIWLTLSYLGFRWERADRS